jgi:Predicted metal-dependent protease of the PAD1/JAB1 superfamily
VKLWVPRAKLEATWSHLDAEAPREGVGLWSGREHRVEEVWPLRNIHPHPEVAYQADPEELVSVLSRLKGELVAIYHSHPNTPAVPSLQDRQQAFWPLPYVILSLRDRRVGAYLLPAGEEVELCVES